MDEFPTSEQKLAADPDIILPAAPSTNLNITKDVESPSLNAPKIHKSKSSGKKGSIKKKICCSCPKSKCLKLYCDCFAYGLYCEGCNCVDCMNKKECEDERKKAMTSIKDRNPLAELRMSAAFEERPSNKAYFKGCHCKKSNCRKKYCECYLARNPCTSQCKCEGCLNCNANDESYNTGKKIATPVTATPFTDSKSTCSSHKSKKKYVTPFIPDLYSSFTKKYSVQSHSNKKRMRSHN
jgi:hypothetical protein